MNRKIAFLLVFTLIAVSSLIAQEFENDDYIFLKRHEKIEIAFEGKDLAIKKFVNEKAKFNSSNKLQYANEVISFDAFTVINDIEAYTFIPETETTIPVDYIETKRVFDNGIFYSDQQFKTFTFPAVKKGAITELRYVEEIKDPRFLGLYRFGTYVPTKSGLLEIEFPNNVEIGYIDFNTSDIDVVFDKDIGKKTTKYSWQVTNLEAFQGEQGSEEALHIIPHIIVYIKNYELKGETVSVLNSEADLYKWYTSLVDQIDNSELSMVYDIAENLVKGINSDRKKTEVIFNWVQDNITYVAFEDGLGGFIPRGAASVCTKKYGDCKDMANLLFEMLNHVGVEAYRAWIGTRNRPYKYNEVPTPMADNHMITAALVDGATIFLDATDSYVPFGLPSGFTQTKEALLGLDENSYKIVVVPTVSAEQNKAVVRTSLELNGETINATEKRDLTGYEKVDFITDYVYKKDDLTEEEFLNNTLTLGNNKTLYTDISIKEFNNSIKPLEVTYNLKIDNYAKSVAGKLIVNMNIDKKLSRSKIDIDKKKYSKKIDHQFQQEFETTLMIPEGYQVSTVPKRQAFEDDRFGFEIMHTKQNGKIIQNKKIYIKTLSVQPDEFEAWNDFIKKLIKAYKKSIILEKIT